MLSEEAISEETDPPSSIEPERGEEDVLGCEEEARVTDGREEHTVDTDRCGLQSTAVCLTEQHTVDTDRCGLQSTAVCLTEQHTVDTDRRGLQSTAVCLTEEVVDNSDRVEDVLML